jgi:hypothetical protein
MPTQGLWADLRAHLSSLRVYGTVIIALDVLRTLCLCALLALSIYATIQAESPEDSKAGDAEGAESLLDALKKKKKNKKKNRNTVGDYSSLEWGEAGACFFYVGVESLPSTYPLSSTTFSSPAFCSV